VLFSTCTGSYSGGKAEPLSDLFLREFFIDSLIIGYDFLNLS